MCVGFPPVAITSHHQPDQCLTETVRRPRGLGIGGLSDISCPLMRGLLPAVRGSSRRALPPPSAASAWTLPAPPAVSPPSGQGRELVRSRVAGGTAPRHRCPVSGVGGWLRRWRAHLTPMSRPSGTRLTPMSRPSGARLAPITTNKFALNLDPYTHQCTPRAGRRGFGLGINRERRPGLARALRRFLPAPLDIVELGRPPKRTPPRRASLFYTPGKGPE
jgi:hypothetical protein